MKGGSLSIGRRTRFAAALLAVSTCLAIEFAADLGFASLLDGHGPAGYTQFVVGLSAALAVAVALLASASSRAVVLTLVFWAATHGLGGTRLRYQILGALVLALTTWIGLTLASKYTRSPMFLGAVTGTALALGWIVAKFFIVSLVPEIELTAEGVVATRLAAHALVFGTLLVLLRTPHLASKEIRVSMFSIAMFALCAAVLAAHHRVDDRAEFPGRVEGPRRPNILLLVLDTLRADHMSLYGYGLPTTPELERLRDRLPRALVYPFAFSTASWTLPAHASLFTGEISSVHQVHLGNGGMEGQQWSVDLGDTLALRLSRAGYRTTGILANPMLTSVDGIDAGFGRWAHAGRPQLMNLPGEVIRQMYFGDRYNKQALQRPSALQVNRAVLRELEHCGEDGCFVFANYMEVHEPYLPGPENAGRFRDPNIERGSLALELPADRKRIEFMSQVYDEAIRDLDADLGRLFDALDSRGWLESMWLVITSDHGEAFYEHAAILHATNLYNEESRIPLMIVPPKGERLPAFDGPVGLLDVAATLSALGTASRMGTGRDLRDPAREFAAVPLEHFGQPGKGERDVGPRGNQRARAVIEGALKLLEINGTLELYDIVADPHETRNLARDRPIDVARLRTLLPPLIVRSDRVTRTAGMPDEQRLKVLRELGYIR